MFIFGGFDYRQVFDPLVEYIGSSFGHVHLFNPVPMAAPAPVVAPAPVLALVAAPAPVVAPVAAPAPVVAPAVAPVLTRKRAQAKVTRKLRQMDKATTDYYGAKKALKKQERLLQAAKGVFENKKSVLEKLTIEVADALDELADSVDV